MSDFLPGELVPPMPPLSMASINNCAEILLEEVQPSALITPQAVALSNFVDYEFPAIGLHFYPAEAEEIKGCEGKTDPSIDPQDPSKIDVLIRRDHWENLFLGGVRANRARTTVAHETGHAFLHVAHIRLAVNSLPLGATLNRVERGTIQAHSDPEWQAWAFAGCFLIPPKTLFSIEWGSIFQICRAYGVSQAFLVSHLKRCLKLTGYRDQAKVLLGVLAELEAA